MKLADLSLFWLRLVTWAHLYQLGPHPVGQHQPHTGLPCPSWPHMPVLPARFVQGLLVMACGLLKSLKPLLSVLQELPDLLGL